MFWWRCSPVEVVSQVPSWGAIVVCHELTDCWVFCAIDAHHSKVAHLASPAEVEQGQAHDSDLLV